MLLRFAGSLLIILCVSLFIDVSSAYSTDIEKSAHYRFYDFVRQYNKVYDNFDEFTHRYNVFRDNYVKILKFNTRNSETYRLSINKFADMTLKEFINKHTGYNRYVKKYGNDEPAVYFDGNTSVTSVDWRTNGVVNPIKDQGQCGSCYAFSAVTALESAWALKTGKLYNLAEQEIVDCDTTDNGCNGGLMDNVWEWVRENGGVVPTSDYPYHARDQNCQFNSTAAVVNVTGHVDVLPNSDDALAAAVALHPVSVAINANNQEFMFYSGGVYDNAACDPSPSALDHGVAVVGYTPDYWIVRNSWGESWGDNGYIYMSRKRNQCGILDAACFPTV